MTRLDTARGAATVFAWLVIAVGCGAIFAGGWLVIAAYGFILLDIPPVGAGDPRVVAVQLVALAVMALGTFYVGAGIADRLTGDPRGVLEDDDVDDVDDGGGEELIV